MNFFTMILSFVEEIYQFYLVTMEILFLISVCCLPKPAQNLPMIMADKTLV